MFLVAPLFSQLNLKLKNLRIPFEVDTPIKCTIFVSFFLVVYFSSYIFFISPHFEIDETKLDTCLKKIKISDLTYTQQNLYLHKVDLMMKLKVSSLTVDL